MTGRRRVIGLRGRMTTRIVDMAVVLAVMDMTMLLTHLAAASVLRDSQCS